MRSSHRLRPKSAALALLPALALLAACASPCDRIDDDFRSLNVEMIRNPSVVTDGTYAAAFQELAAQSVEHSCLRR